MVEPLEQEGAIRQAREPVVQRALTRLFRRLAQVGTGLRVEEVCGGDVGQGLGRGHRRRVERADAVAEEVEPAWRAD